MARLRGVWVWVYMHGRPCKHARTHARVRSASAASAGSNGPCDLWCLCAACPHAGPHCMHADSIVLRATNTSATTPPAQGGWRQARPPRRWGGPCLPSVGHTLLLACVSGAWQGRAKQGPGSRLRGQAPPTTPHRTPLHAQPAQMSFLGVGAPEALLVGVVALVVFGPKGLAEVRGRRRVEEEVGCTSASASVRTRQRAAPPALTSCKQRLAPYPHPSSLPPHARRQPRAWARRCAPSSPPSGKWCPHHKTSRAR